MGEQQVKESLGIDISKLTIDAGLHHRGLHEQFANNRQGFKAMLKWLSKLGVETDNLIICFEHTGWYCLRLSHFFLNSKIKFHCANPLEIKRSIGLKRKKTDKQDSFEIARYAWLHREELDSSEPMSEQLIELQRMMAFRTQLVKQMTALKNQKSGMKMVSDSPSTDFSIRLIDQTLRHLKGQLKKLEKQMQELIKADKKMQSNFELSKTVKGVGPILAMQMLLHTHNYSRFEAWRQFSAYCGLVPYEHSSGTSINRRPRTHSISDHSMKSLLSLSALSAIRCDAELKTYYQKRVEEGKEKMVVLNIIRNKIVSRVFATVKRGTPFVPLSKHAA
jgi:transposase